MARATDLGAGRMAGLAHRPVRRPGGHRARRHAGVGRGRKLLQAQAARWLGRELAEDAATRWFGLFERYALPWCSFRRNGGLSFAGTRGATLTPGLFALRVISILAAARLLTLASRALRRTDLRPGRAAAEPETRVPGILAAITRLFPLGRRCFEAAVYIQAASLCVQELHQFAFVALYGPNSCSASASCSAPRAIIELLQVLLDELFGLNGEGRTADQKKRTLVPLLHSGCQYVLYFGALVMMLDVLGQDTKWLLAAAGTIGPGLRPGRPDAGDRYRVGLLHPVRGPIPGGRLRRDRRAPRGTRIVAVRNTQIRDDQGKLHIIPNGQIKQVVNYSKGFVNAIVDIRVPLRGEVEATHRAMTEAGRLLRQTRREVLGETQVEGLIELTLAEITIRR